MARPQSSDTDLDTDRRMFERYRGMSVDEKLEHMSALARLAMEVALAGLRARYPDATDEENRLRLASRWIDRETMIRVYGWDPDLHGR